MTLSTHAALSYRPTSSSPATKMGSSSPALTSYPRKDVNPAIIGDRFLGSTILNKIETILIKFNKFDSLRAVWRRSPPPSKPLPKIWAGPGIPTALVPAPSTCPNVWRDGGAQSRLPAPPPSPAQATPKGLYARPEFRHPTPPNPLPAPKRPRIMRKTILLLLVLLRLLVQ